MLKVLGIWDSLEPVFLDADHACRFIIEGKTYDFPIGKEKIIEKLKSSFPNKTSAIEMYFHLIDEVCNKTDNMDIRHLQTLQNPQPYDFVSLKQVLDELTDCAELKTLLSGYSMCHRTPPSQISFANHARVCRYLRH